MKAILKVLSVTMISVFLVAGSAMAITFGDGGAALQGVFDGITKAPVPGDSSVDVTSDYIADSIDSFWDIQGSGGSIATMIVELAGFATGNIFGIYDPATLQTTAIFAGSNTPGDQTVLSILADGSIYVGLLDTGHDLTNPNSFGLFLDSSVFGNGGLFYSDTTQNSDGLDHMAAYQGNDVDTIQIPPFAKGTFSSDEWIFAWEDLKASATDADYTDMVVLMESVEPIPEPTTILLSGLGLLGMGAYLRRRRNAKKA